MRRQAAALKIQKHIKRHQARVAYQKLHISALVLQTGLRAMAARREFRSMNLNKNATLLQVILSLILGCLLPPCLSL